MKDFTRVAWVSDDARAEYEPRIQAAAKAWLQAEIESVLVGLRPAGLIFNEPPKGMVGLRVAPNRYAIGPLRHQLAEAYDRGDNDGIGSLLGFPSCCRSFFELTWGKGALDTTYEMANGNANGPLECNILGRWLGLRWVTHLPCSFRCERTRQIGLEYRKLVDPMHAQTIDEVLSWQAEWSALHGVAEVRFPVLKISTRTTYTATELKVQRHGTVPAGAPRGLGFPYSNVAKPLTLAVSDHRDNGFSTAEVQHRMHGMVLAALATQSAPQGLVVDLGAGTGTLMDKIAKRFAVSVGGVEIVQRKATKHDGIVAASVETFPQHFSNIDTLVVSQQRFKEIPGLEDLCRAHARQCLVYSYDHPTFANFL